MCSALSDKINALYTHATSVEQAIDELNNLGYENLNETEVADLMVFKSYLKRILTNIVVEEKKLSGLVYYHYKVIYYHQYGDPLELQNWLDGMLKEENLS
jgi:hypothetical protein